MNLLKIAARIVAKRELAAPKFPQIEFKGPFFPAIGDKKPDHETEITLDFGIVGKFAQILADAYGEDLSAIQEGPIPDVTVGYDKTKEQYRPGLKSYNRNQPNDPDEYDLDIEIVSIAGYALSESDRALLKGTGIVDRVKMVIEENLDMDSLY